MQQFLCWGRGKCLVLFGGQGTQPVAGLRRNHDPSAARGNDVPELLQDDSHSVQIDSEDRLRRCLAGRDARGMDHARDVTPRRGALHERVDRFARGNIDRRGVGVEASVGKHLGGRIGVRLVEVGEHDMFPGTDPASNRLADLPRPDNDSYLSHEHTPSY